jgi:predicted RNase H-like HicB family nuclease
VGQSLRLLAPNVSRKHPLFASPRAAVCKPLHLFHMSDLKRTHPLAIQGKGMKTDVFRVVIKRDEDWWSAHYSALLTYDAAMWGNTQEEALKHHPEVVQMVVEAWLEEGDPIPEDVQRSREPLVAMIR